MESKIGMKVVLLREMLQSPVGTVGYVFDEYPDFDNNNELGVQIILSTSFYCGFSIEEQNKYLRCLSIDPRYSLYEFKNVLQVYRDYQAGYWKFYE